MEDEQKSALRRCRVRMVKDLDIDQMMDVFDTRELFTPIMMEYIKVKKLMATATSERLLNQVLLKTGDVPVSPTPSPISPMICPISPTPVTPTPISPTPISPTPEMFTIPVSPTHSI